MPILTIRHVTTYHYRRPVAFGEHVMMLRPRDDGDQRVVEADLEISPKPSRLSWARDAFGNHVASGAFRRPAEELRFSSTVRLDHAPTEFDRAAIEAEARTLPFTYPLKDRADTRTVHGVDWAASGCRSLGGRHFSAMTVRPTPATLLVAMTRTIKRTLPARCAAREGHPEPDGDPRIARAAVAATSRS